MKPIIAANFKMHQTPAETEAYIQTLKKLVNSIKSKSKIILFPPFTSLDRTQKLLSNSIIQYGAQNMHPESKGAFTGEISASMLANLGCKWVLIGHSERRNSFNESHDFIYSKLKTAFQNNLTPVLCIGETFNERQANQTNTVLKNQLNSALKNLEKYSKKPGAIVIAYEPIWAIGSGVASTPEMAQKTHAFIRSHLAHLLSNEIAAKIPILYGGSVKPTNCKALQMQNDINGALVGSASLTPTSFYEIIVKGS